MEISAPVTVFQTYAGYADAVDQGASIQGNIDGTTHIGMTVPEPLLWSFFREQLIADPQHVADQVGIPDHYVNRMPGTVSNAIEAIEGKYFAQD